MTKSEPTPPKVTDRNDKVRNEVLQKQAERQAQQMQAQQREYNFRRNLDIRKVQALEAIAEALFVTNEEKITAWRIEQDAKAEAQQKAIEAAKAKAIATAAPKDDEVEDQVALEAIHAPESAPGA